MAQGKEQYREIIKANQALGRTSWTCIKCLTPNLPKEAFHHGGRKKERTNMCMSCRNKINREKFREQKAAMGEMVRRWKRDPNDLSCEGCLVDDLTRDDFYWQKNKTGSQSRGRLCRECLRAIKVYGIPVETYRAMLVKAEEIGCYICRSPRREFKGKKRHLVDHCHDTGKVRGLLCSNCNNGIGFLRENVDTLRNAITYLEASRQAGFDPLMDGFPIPQQITKPPVADLKFWTAAMRSS